MTKFADVQSEQHAVTSPELEALAELCHEQWCGWMRYMFGKGKIRNDGSWTMPPDYVKRWQRQTITLYDDLSLTEQDSDRTEAHKFLTLFRQFTEGDKVDDTIISPGKTNWNNFTLETVRFSIEATLQIPGWNNQVLDALYLAKFLVETCIAQDESLHTVYAERDQLQDERDRLAEILANNGWIPTGKRYI